MDNSTLEQRFWRKVFKDEDCWEWEGQKHNAGYGRLDRVVKGKRTPMYAHRISWQLHYGSIPRGMHVLHRCDNPSCVNPTHLFLGTQRANNADKIAKNRQAMGVKFPHAKLTPSKVRAIRRKYAKGGITLQQLAYLYGIAFGQIGAIIRREAWKHV
jgi:hypothetical protein